MDEMLDFAMESLIKDKKEELRKQNPDCGDEVIDILVRIELENKYPMYFIKGGV